MTAPTWLWMIAPRAVPIAPHSATPASPPSASSRTSLLLSTIVMPRPSRTAEPIAQPIASPRTPNAIPARAPATNLAVRTCERAGFEQNGRADRAVAVLAGHEQDARERREHAREAPEAQQLTLVLCAHQPGWVGQ